MIQLSDDEMLLLEDTFEGVPDKLLIRELVRRKRLRQVEAGTLFYPEIMRTDDNYATNIREHVIRMLAHSIAGMTDVRPALFSESVAPSILATSDGLQRPRQNGEGRLTGDIVFLVARDKKEG